MFARLLSSLTVFVSPPPLLPGLFIAAAVVSFLVARRSARGTGPGRSPPPAGSSIPCLPWLPVLGSLPWLAGGLPPHLLFTQLAHR